MDSTYCLNIPAPNALEDISNASIYGHSLRRNRFVFVSKDEILHQAGNRIQITKLPLPSSNSTKDSKDDTYSQLTKSQLDTNGPTFAEAELGRGFSSFCFNRFRRRVAYSPRSTNPSIFIKALPGQELLCKIDRGVELEYADICFNQTGTKLAAIGKGEIDAILLVWSIEAKTSCGTESQFEAVLVTKFKFKYSVSRCLFNPTNDDQISLLHADGQSVTLCQLSKFVNEWKVQERFFNLSGILNDSGDCGTISVLTWEAENQLLIGTSCGSIYRLKDQSERVETILSHNFGKGNGTVCGIIVTTNDIIIGYQKGKLHFMQRLDPGKTNLNLRLEKEILMNDNDEIMEISCDPSFRNLFVLTRSGDLWNYPLDESSSEQSFSHGIDGAGTGAKRFANIHSGILSSLTSLILTGQASVTLLISGGLDGKLKVLKDSTMTKYPTLQSTIAYLDLESPITALETLQGYPVCAVGSADGCLRFVHVGRSKETTTNTPFNSTLPVDMIVLKSEILSFAPITSLVFATNTKKLVASCFESGQAFVLCAEPTNLHVLGVVETIDKTPICATSWCTQHIFNLIIGGQSGKIWCFDTTAMCFSPDPLTPLWELSFGLTTPVKLMSIAEYGESKIIYITQAGTNEFKAFEITKVNSYYVSSSEENYSFTTLSKQCCCLTIENELIIMGSESGGIAVFGYDEGRKLRQIFKKNAHIGPVIAITISSDKSRVYSTSTDGSLYVHSIRDPVAIVQSAYEYDYLVSNERSILSVRWFS